MLREEKKKPTLSCVWWCLQNIFLFSCLSVLSVISRSWVEYVAWHCTRVHHFTAFRFHECGGKKAVLLTQSSTRAFFYIAWVKCRQYVRDCAAWCVSNAVKDYYYSSSLKFVCYYWDISNEASRYLPKARANDMFARIYSPGMRPGICVRYLRYFPPANTSVRKNVLGNSVNVTRVVRERRQEDGSGKIVEQWTGLSYMTPTGTVLYTTLPRQLLLSIVSWALLQ